ncbi:putative Late nodulin [Medicago truncatula]|uniref:Late nodulin n=1 Tax=Medicago truncatula TaxID=3880 RepID=G7LHJ5_MEDTR|nr:late nodulin [Medicago truncatula]RHN40332.1 putative Late nodulin [Medicago truncatula]
MDEIIKFLFVMVIYLLMFTIVIDATSFCDSVKDCREPAFFCEPPKIARCVMLFCRCD